MQSSSALCHPQASWALESPAPRPCPPAFGGLAPHFCAFFPGHHPPPLPAGLQQGGDLSMETWTATPRTATAVGQSGQPALLAGVLSGICGGVFGPEPPGRVFGPTALNPAGGPHRGRWHLVPHLPQLSLKAGWFRAGSRLTQCWPQQSAPNEWDAIRRLLQGPAPAPSAAVVGSRPLMQDGRQNLWTPLPRRVSAHVLRTPVAEPCGGNRSP